MIFLNLLNNIALLVTLSAVHGMIMRRWKAGGRAPRIVSGMLFGAVAIVGMATPLRIEPGIIFDGRSIVISVGGLFGGPVVGAIAAAIAATYRLWLGGAGALMGVSVIAESACIGVGYHYLRRRRPRVTTPWHFLGFGLLVHLVMLLLTVTLPGNVSTAVLHKIALSVLTIYPVGTLLICMLFLDQESRLKAEAALRESEDRYRSLFEAANDAIFVMTEDRFVDCNPGTLTMFGCNREQILAARPHDFSPEYQPDGRLSAEKAGERISAAYGGVAQFFEWRHHRLDGEVFEAEISLSRVSIAGETCLLASVRDVTKRKQAEAEIRRLNTELEDRVRARTAQLELANQELEAFSYSVSHDLRAPLRAMGGFARILLEEYAPRLEPKAAHYLRRVHENALQMGQLVDDLLAFSRLTRQSLQVQRVAPADLVHEVLADLSAEQQGRLVEFVIADLPACQADRSLLKQVFANLLSNALKYTRGRSPARIEVGVLRSGDEPVYFVRDNGVGFDMRYADKLFGVFQRLHRAEEFEGTGVGLATVQRIVHRHGGRVWAEAEPDKGATFCFTLKGGLTDGSRAG